jgi:hypothetical protein
MSTTARILLSVPQQALIARSLIQCLYRHVRSDIEQGDLYQHFIERLFEHNQKKMYRIDSGFCFASLDLPREMDSELGKNSS